MVEVSENLSLLSNSLDLDETPNYSVSNPDPSCLHIALWLWLVV